MTKLAYCLLCEHGTGDGNIACSLMKKDCGEAQELVKGGTPEWCPLPISARRTMRTRAKAKPGRKRRRDGNLNCIGAYLCLAKCTNCANRELCISVWSDRQWNTHCKSGYGRRVENDNNSWDNMVRVIECNYGE